MKGISDVIAMLLMLVITIGLVGVAYSYISGVFTSRTAVILTVDPALSFCNSTHITVGLRNDGTAPSGSVTIVIYDPIGKSASDKIGSVPPGSTNSTSISRSGLSAEAGYYRVVASTSGASTNGMIYCSS